MNRGAAVAVFAAGGLLLAGCGQSDDGKGYQEGAADGFHRALDLGPGNVRGPSEAR
ncbi:hypothetical protein [Streptomyces sp. WM4235]|uniref:hypothetical protein n=1 Tax=Streptomyces sp. WM4235 TaxID=1415551 RepID=UPI00131BB557|nr:hypothetical protein [Streptomyces sp. WM4235]